MRLCQQPFSHLHWNGRTYVPGPSSHSTSIGRLAGGMPSAVNFPRRFSTVAIHAQRACWALFPDMQDVSLRCETTLLTSLGLSIYCVKVKTAAIWRRL